MIRVLFVSYLLFQLLAISHAQESLIMTNQLEKWENSKEYTLSIIDLMPDTDIDFKPTEEEMSFKEIAIHMVNNMIWLSEDYLDYPNFKSIDSSREINKSELKQLLSDAYDHSYKALSLVQIHDLPLKVDFFAGEMNIQKIIELMDDHATHHRGQLTTYLRLKGIKPPRYVGW